MSKNKQQLTFRIKDNVTRRGITWSSSFVNCTKALPTKTINPSQMKTAAAIEKEIKRLKAQVKKIKKAAKTEGFAKGIGSVMRIITLESNLHALAWVLDQENKITLGFNLKTPKNEKNSPK